MDNNRTQRLNKKKQVSMSFITYNLNAKDQCVRCLFIKKTKTDKLKYHKMNELTLLNFSPSWCGNSDRKLWKPAFMLCIRRLSLLFAISRRIRFSFSIFIIPPPSSFNLKIRKLKCFKRISIANVDLMHFSIQLQEGRAKKKWVGGTDFFSVNRF